MIELISTTKLKIIFVVCVGIILSMCTLILFNLKDQDLRTPQELHVLAKKLAGPDAVNCGQSPSIGNASIIDKKFFKAHACAVSAYKNHKNFYVLFIYPEFGFLKMLLGVTNFDYVIRTPNGEFKLIRWKQHSGKITNDPVEWTLRNLEDVYPTAWSNIDNDPILHYSDDQTG